MTLRTPLWRDLDDLVELVNSLVAEQADINRDEPVTREQETDWLANTLAKMEKDQAIAVVAEVDGHAVGSSGVSKRSGAMSHVGDLGIMLRREYRNLGIGTEMMRTLIEEARKMGLEALFLRCFESNAQARHVYAKVGFRETGREAKAARRNGRYQDLVIMALEL